jgi:hypothetical protein
MSAKITPPVWAAYFNTARYGLWIVMEMLWIFSAPLGKFWDRILK